MSMPAVAQIATAHPHNNTHAQQQQQQQQQQHSAICAQGYHHLPFTQQSHQHQHPGPWADQHFQQHSHHSLASPTTDGKMDPHHHHHNQWQTQPQSIMRPQFSHPYTTDMHQCAVHLPRPTEMPPTPAPFAYVNPAAAHAPNMPSPPPSDGSPRTEWASYSATTAVDTDQAANQLRYNRNSPILRPDGVRKKNAKFDIPEERNLDTLDELIRNAKDEVERKELKMQKRLLRNREAALHSRQKKKSHTDTLERENKKLVTKINEFQHTITDLQIRVDDHDKERDAWTKQVAAADDRARNLGLERDAAHKENARLSAELDAIRAQLRSVSTSPTGTAPPATGPQSATPAGPQPPSSFADGSVGLTGCGMDGPEWHAEPSYDFMSDLYLEPGKVEARADVVVH